MITAHSPLSALSSPHCHFIARFISLQLFTFSLCLTRQNPQDFRRRPIEAFRSFALDQSERASHVSFLSNGEAVEIEKGKKEVSSLFSAPGGIVFDLLNASFARPIPMRHRRIVYPSL